MRTVAIRNVPDLKGWIAAALICAGPATAQDLRADAFHLFYSNDSNAAPRLDRWRTVAASGEWTFALSGTHEIGLRLGAEIVAPRYLNAPGPDPDRAFAGIWRAEVIDYRTHGQFDTTVHAGLAVTGPQTGLASFLDAAHGVLDGVPIGPAITSGQISDAVYLSGRTEVAWNRSVGPWHLRPFMAASTGLETLGRVGVDIAWGGATGRLRMPVTGALMGGSGKGWQFGAGVDAARLWGSDLIPDGSAVTLAPTRYRARMSIGRRIGDHRATFGLGYLSPEFEEQASGQWIGTVGWSTRF